MLLNTQNPGRNAYADADSISIHKGEQKIGDWRTVFDKKTFNDMQLL